MVWFIYFLGSDYGGGRGYDDDFDNGMKCNF